jgi:hypothetical protein
MDTTTAGGGLSGTAVLREVRAERAQVRGQMEALAGRDAWLASFEAQLAEWEAHRARVEAALAGVPDVQPGAPGPVDAQAATATPFASSQSDAVAAILRRHAPRPLTTQEIVDEMIAAGYPMAGPAETRHKRLAASLYSLLRRRTRRFARVGPGRWRLVQSLGAGELAAAAVPPAAEAEEALT